MARALPGEARSQTVERVGDAGDQEDEQRGAQPAVDDQQHERRHQHDAQDRELVGDGQVTHVVEGGC